MNWILALLMYSILIFGIYMIESAARHVSISPDLITQYGNAGKYHAAMQKKWILIGSVVFLITALLDYRWIKWLSVPAYIGSLGLMALAMMQDDKVHRINIGGLSFQPASLGICAGILLIAFCLDVLPRKFRLCNHPMIKILIIGIVSGIPFLMIMKMGDMGSALVWIPVIIVAIWMANIPMRYLFSMACIGAGVLPLVYFIALPLVSKRGPERIDLWLRMMSGKQVDISNEAYAPYYVSMAVGKAGWKGVGRNATAEQGSLHDKAYIPKDTAHNDYIYAVFAEEFGFRGSLLLVTFYASILLIGMIIAYYSRDVMGRLLTTMILTLLFSYFFESVGMCVLLLPITGIPMPFMSYSGTFVVICMFFIGLIQSVWIHRETMIHGVSNET